jgi:hypothetical protein
MFTLTCLVLLAAFAFLAKMGEKGATHLERRKFYRRNAQGLEVFDSFEEMLRWRRADNWLFKTSQIATLIGVWGFLLTALVLWWVWYQPKIL